MTTVRDVLSELAMTGPVRRVLDYHRGSGPTPRAEEFVRAAEWADGRLCLRRVTNDGVRTVCHRNGRWRCSEYERLLDRTNVGRVSREAVLDWLDGTRPSVVVYEDVRESFRGSDGGDERPLLSDGGGDGIGSGRDSEVGRDGGGGSERTASDRRERSRRSGPTGRRTTGSDEPARRADAIRDLETATGAMTAVDWSVVPEVSAPEAAAWTVRLVAARDALSAEIESSVPASSVARASEEVGKA